MPRIAHVISTPTGIGGAERVLEDLLVGGAGRGWEQHVLNPFALDPEGAAIRHLRGGAQYEGRRCASLRELPATRRWLRTRLASLAPDLVHAHLFHATSLVASLPVAGRTLTTHHHVDVLEFEKRRLEARIDRWAGRRYDRIVAVSLWGERFLRQRYGYAPESITVIPNGWTGSPRKPDLSERPPTVVCVANLRPEKGHTYLLSAFAEVLEVLPSARLRIVGDGELRGQLGRQAAELDIAEPVDFVGRVDDVWAELSRADVFTLASPTESLGIAILEAMAAGLPVVATDVGGIPELVDPGVTGILVPPTDVGSLAAALLALLQTPERARSLGAAGREAAELMRGEVAVQSYFALYGEML